MRRALLSLVVLAWPVAAATAAVTTHDVAVRDNSYDPATITIGVGDSVRWTNRGLTRHSVTFRSGTSDVLLPTEDTTQAFPHAGTYRYSCDFHDTMEGTVLVRGTSGSTNRSTTTTTEPPGGSARTGAPEESTTTTSSTTTTTVAGNEGTTTTTEGGIASGALPGPDDDSGEPDVGGPAAVAALLLLAAGGAAFLATRTSLP